MLVGAPSALVLADPHLPLLAGARSRSACLLALLVGAAGQARLSTQNRSVYLDGIGPHLFRAVLYAPVPWGTDNDLYFKTGYYAQEYTALFRRDLQMISLMGANAVRLHGFLGVANNLERHTAFLDEAFAQRISVFLSYDLTGTGDGSVSLVSPSDQEEAVTSFRTYLFAARHRATVIVFIGASVNRFDAGFVCDAGRDSFGFITVVPCQFGEDTDALAAALDLLCREARLLGLACTVPFAHIPLPRATHVEKFGELADRPSRGVVDWLDVMSRAMPNMNVLSASLAASNTSRDVTFEIDLNLLPSQLPDLPFIVAEYGVDAFNSTEWFEKAGVLLDESYPLLRSDFGRVDARGRIYQLTGEGRVDTAEDEASQAQWLGALALEIEQQATSQAESCGCGRAVSGGIVRSWRDEWWRSFKPSYEGICAFNDICFAMEQLCPYAAASSSYRRSPCGAPFPRVQPDGYVNEEWFGLISSEPSCACAADQSQCAAHELRPRPRAAYFALQALWRPAAAAAARAAFANASAANATSNCTRADAPWSCERFPAQPRLQHRPGTLELYLDCELFLMRGVSYSPVPFGNASLGVLGKDPGFSEPWGDFFTDEYHDIFQRDMYLMKAMGANTIRLYTFKTSVRHGSFLDMAYANNLSVVAAFSIGAATQTSLGSLKDLSLVKAQLRLQIRSSVQEGHSSVHPAITMWLVGNELNGAWHFFVCDQYYVDNVLPEYGLTRCQFGEDAAALLRAIDYLCSVVTREGLLCSTALADVPLPPATQALPQYDARLVLGWLRLMDGSSEEFTLRHIGVWSLNLYFGRNFTLRNLFEDYETYGLKLPLLVTEYGIDALDTNAWYHTCFGLGNETSCGANTNLEQFVDEEMQADWVLSLVEDLERHATTCQAGCLSRTVSGGSVMAWVDESWKGRIIDALAADERSAKMACPDARSDIHSLCGYPSGGQPDTFVNEEWFGLNAVHSVCRTVDQLRPRLTWHGLSLLWKQGGCIPHLGQPTTYSSNEYPLCGSYMKQLRQVWFEQEKDFSATPLPLRSNVPNAEWLSKIAALASTAHGDSDCSFQALLHDQYPQVCPAAPEHMQDWVRKAQNASTADLLTPQTCDAPIAEFPFSSIDMIFLLLAFAVVAAFVGVNARYFRPRWSRHPLRKRAAGLLSVSTAKKGTRISLTRRGSKLSRGSSTRFLGHKPNRSAFGKFPKKAQAKSNVRSQTVVEPEYVRSVLQPIASRLCDLFGFQSSQRAVSRKPGMFRREVVPSNEANAVEHLTAVISSGMQRVPGRNLQVKLDTAVEELHEVALSSFRVWCDHMNLPYTTFDSAGKRQQLMLFYLIWGEAANLRHMPELLCFILYCTNSALANTSSVGGGTNDSEDVNIIEVAVPQCTGAPASTCASSVVPLLVKLPVFKQPTQTLLALRGLSSTAERDAFLSHVVTPIYNFLRGEMRTRESAHISERTMYDDVNEFFWCRKNLDCLLQTDTAMEGVAYPKLLHAFSNERRLHGFFRKTYVEHGSWGALFYTFYRVFLLNGLAVHAMAVFAFTEYACKKEANVIVPDLDLKNERALALEHCLLAAHGSFGWRQLSTVTLTHAGMQLTYFLWGWRIVPRNTRTKMSLMLNVVGILVSLFPIGLYLHERFRSSFQTGLSDVFQLGALLYAAVWLPALVQMPLQLPGYLRSWGGIAPQWTMRQPLEAGVYSWAFWTLVVSVKWIFEYELIVKPLYEPTLALWEGDYRCWDMGHTGPLDCFWDRHSSHILQSLRDWSVRLVLVGLRWAMPMLFILSDTVVFYTVLLCIGSTLLARKHGVGALQTWAHLITGFMDTQLLFAEKIMAYSPQFEEQLQAARAIKQEKALKGLAWSYEGTSREWQDFGIAWNGIITSLRARDFLSNSERDDLLFDSLSSPESEAHFGFPVYTTLPSMLSTPLFAVSGDKSFIKPTFSSYAALRPVLLQLRDLLSFILVMAGVLDTRDVEKFRALSSDLMSNVQSLSSGRVNNRSLLWRVTVKLEAFIRKCMDAGKNAGQNSRKDVELVTQMFTSIDQLLDTAETIFSQDSHRDSTPRHSIRAGVYSKLVRKASSTFSLKQQSPSFFFSHTSSQAVPRSNQEEISNLLEHEDDGMSTWEKLRITLRRHQHPTTEEIGRILLALKEPASLRTCSVLSRVVSTKNPGGEPQSVEALRQLVSFCSSLRMSTLSKPPPLREMKSLSVLTPYFNEEVAYSIQALQAANDDNTTLLTILRALYANDWVNLCERVELQESDVTEDNEHIEASSMDTSLGKSLERWNAIKLKMNSVKALCDSVSLSNNQQRRASLSAPIAPASSPTRRTSMRVELSPKPVESSKTMPVQAHADLTLMSVEEDKRSEVVGDPHESCPASRSADPQGSTSEQYKPLNPLQHSHSSQLGSSTGTLASGFSRMTITAPEIPEGVAACLSPSGEKLKLDMRRQSPAFNEARQNHFVANLIPAAGRPLSHKQELDRELRCWASDRAQVLSRTVRGVMAYAEALRLLARIEDVPEAEIEALVASKFEYIVSCQVYMQLKRSKKWGDEWKAECIDELRYSFPEHLRVAYVHKDAKAGSYFSVLLGVDADSREEQVLFKVKLPGNPIIGEGKPENQNQAIIFSRGEHLQTLDMNQDNYLGEAFKLRNSLDSFKGSIRLVGFREYTFSEGGGVVAEFAATNEFAFVSIIQRFLTYPLCVRFHYGHPDIWDKRWSLINGGISKASRTLHLSEDIFAGVNVLARGGRIAYSEFIHIGKGRDVTFIATNGFEQKIAGGNALQSLSRDMSRFAHHVDLARLLSFWCSGPGFFASSSFVLYAGYFLALTLLIFAMTNLESYFDTPGSMHDVRFSTEAKPNFGTSGTEETYNVQFLLQLGFLAVLPVIVEECIEFGFGHAMLNFVRQQLSFKLLYTLFQERTRSFYYAQGLQGRASYIATGRSHLSMTSDFTALFKLYARSHMEFAAEITRMLIAYGLFSRAYSYPSLELTNYAIYTFPLWLLVIGCAFSPWLFSPTAFSSRSLLKSFKEFLMWTEQDECTSCWQEWENSNWKGLESASVADRVGLFVKNAFLRGMLFLTAGISALEVADLPPTSLAYQREYLCLALGCAVVASTGLLFFLRDSGSARQLVKNVWVRFCIFWVLRVVMVIAFMATFFSFAQEVLPATKRNISSVLIMGGAWITQVTQVFRLIPIREGSTASFRKELRRFADFVQRENDVCMASALFVCLQAISILPIAYIHSILVVNHAYASSLRRVRRRRTLMLALFKSGWLSGLYCWLAKSLRTALESPFCLMLQRTRTGWVPLQGSIQTWKKVFAPSIEMPERLNHLGPFALERKWALIDKAMDVYDVGEENSLGCLGVGTISACAEDPSTAGALYCPSLGDERCASTPSVDAPSGMLPKPGVNEEQHNPSAQEYLPPHGPSLPPSSPQSPTAEEQPEDVAETEAIPCAAPELCQMPVAALCSVEPSFVRKFVQPIAKALSSLFGFQQSQRQLESNLLVHSNMDTQIGHLTSLLKWRMDRSQLLENRKDSFERAVNDLHNKIFSNYKRWVRHVNVQHALTEPEGSVTAESSSFGNLRGAPLLPLTAVSGDAWQSIGMWRFVSNEDEREWTCNAQLHQLVLWYLIWGEAANLRHVPELLCFIFYCACNALQLSTRSSWEVATFVEAVDDDGPYGKEDFLNSIVSPIYEFLKLEVLTRKEDLVCERVMYDDVNETFWSVEGVHSMLPDGCAQVECPEANSEPGAPRRAYAHLRNLLTKSEGNVSSLNVYFRKTYREVPGWPHLYQVFSRVFIFHAVLLHLTIAISFEGFRMEYLFTAVITHALLKALRTIIFMYLVWPLKKAQQDAARTKSQQRSEPSRRASARQLHAFIAVGSSRILGYLLVPLVYIVETMARRRWSRECLAPAAWCDKHVINGIADAYSPACRGADGLDYLLEFCKDCLSNEKDVSATCGLLTDFAYECTAICTSEVASRNDVFLVVAAVYTVIFLGSEILLTRPGSVSNFHWARHATVNHDFGLPSPYIATPELLRIPIRTAFLGYCTWCIVLTIKLLFAYYFLFAPLVKPIRLIYHADFSCWTPWGGSSTNPICSIVLGGNGISGSIRNFFLKWTLLISRALVPCMTFFLDTCLWLSWIIGCLSSASGYLQKKNKATGWADVISGFSETSFQYHACLCNDAQLNPLLFENQNLKAFDLVSYLRLLSGPEMEPARIPEAAGALSVEARSAHWQRWGRVWNEIIHNMRERDYLSNLERDELLFFALREPEHVAVFGTPEYLVFPTMLTAPVFDTHPWNRGHFTRYQHTVRTMLQTRDLFAWLLIALGVVEKRELGPLLNALTSVSSRAGESLRSPTSEQVARLTELRKAVVAFLVIVSQLPSSSDNSSTPSEGFVEPLLSPESRNVNSSTGSNSSEMARELELQLTIVLDAVKMLISQDTSAANFSANCSPDDGRAVKTEVAAYKQLRKLISLESLRDENKWQQAVASSQLKAFSQIVDALHRSFSTPSPGSTPASDEVHRQVLFFVNSLRDRAIGTAAPVRKMKTMTTLIPYFKEDVSYSEQSLKTMDDEGVNLENLLQALFAREWQNMCERVRHRGDESDPVPYQILKEWASDRGQVLSRSVRGVMLYADALRIQARLERVPEEEVEAVISAKFEFVVSCQCYGQLRDSPRADERWKADCIDELRHAFPANLRIAFVEETDDSYYSVLLGVDPVTQEEITLSKVRLPGTPIIGEGKPENQNHAIIFTKGEYLQTLDMNQDNYLGEALKLRNLLEGFKGSIRLTGFREYIFSERGGAVAAFAATSEFVFGTSLQRFLAHPMCVRFHYGHPDVWDKQWALTNGGVSKASRTLHLSEDIFAGFNCSMRGGSIAYVEFIHVGKGRDMGFVAVNAFDQKISTGNALQCTSRELYRIGKGFDFPRLLSFYFTACGYFVTNRLTTNVLYLIILCWLFVALLQAEKLQVLQTANGEVHLAPEWNTPGPAGAGGRVLADNSPTGDSFFHNSTIGFLGELEQRLAQIRSSWSDTSRSNAVEIASQTSVSTYEESWGIFQLGFFAMLPYFFELWLERGFLFSVHHNVFLLACLSWVFFLFTSQTKGYYFSSALATGKADYVSTGRGFVIEPGSFISLYSIFAKSHFHDGVEAFIYATVFQAATTLGGYDTWTIRIYVGSLLLAPLMFNPQMLSVTTMKHAFAELQLWLAGDAISFSAEHRGSWTSWHNFRLKTSRGRPLISKIRIVSIGILQRIVLLSGVAARLETNSGSKASWRSLLILSSCTFFCMFQVIFYVFACCFSTITARGNSFLGFSRIALAFRLVLASLIIVLYAFLHHQLLSQYILLDFSWNGFLNMVLLIFSGGSVGSFLIQVFAVLDSTEYIDPRVDGHGIICVKAALRRYSEFWYFGFDAAVSMALSLVWVLIAMMPILYLQSRLLFNRDFANVITLKIRRSEFLTKLLS